MLDDNTTAPVVEELEAAVAAGRPGDRLPSVRELMRRHGAGPVTVQRAVAPARRARAGRGAAGPRHVRRAAAPAPRPRRPTTAGRPSRSGARQLDAVALEDLLRPPPPGMLVLSTGYLPDDLQPRGALGQALARAARRPGAWGSDPGRGPRAAARAARGLARRRARRGRRHRHRRRPGRRSPPCLRGLAAPGGAGGRRVADLPRRARRRPCRGPRPRAGPERRARRAARPARRRARRAPAPGSSTCSRRSRTRTAPSSPPAGAPPCSTPSAPRAPS